MQDILNLILKRDILEEHFTLGKLYEQMDVRDEFICFTVEDRVRELIGEPVSSWKVYGKTAIPLGRYEVKITQSRRFGKPLPLLIAVPGFEGIRIHGGNTHEDTDGCILPGLVRTSDGVASSQLAVRELMERINAANETWLTIENEDV